MKKTENNFSYICKKNKGTGTTVPQKSREVVKQIQRVTTNKQRKVNKYEYYMNYGGLACTALRIRNSRTVPVIGRLARY